MIRALLATLILLGAGQASAECAIQAFAQDPNESLIQFEDFTDHTSGATETNENHMIAPLVTASNLSVVVDVAPGTSNTWIITLKNEGSNTALTCTISNAETSCTDVANTVALSAFDRPVMAIDPNSTAPDAAALIKVSFCWSETP